jgi:catechol 2,3-dioxygenase-like lactoylglutathione lyase family enzyme
MTISNVQVVSVPVSDQDRAKEFYVNVLGFEVLQDMAMGPEMRWLQVAPKGSQASLTLVTWFDTMPAGSLRGLVVHTPDLEATMAQMTANGYTFDAEIDEQPWGRFLSFNDPDGNGLILRQPGSMG